MKKNSQCLRTRKAITNALISLLKEKPFEKITVQDILDRTPVTRATFYSHFHDKYEIVEKLNDYFFEICENTRNELKGASPAQAQTIIQKTVQVNRDLVETLLKIRTTDINLKETIAKELEKLYLQDEDLRCETLGKQTEARIYAQARTEAYLAFLYDNELDYSLEYMNSIYLNVSLKLLKLSDDAETIEFLKKKLHFI